MDYTQSPFRSPLEHSRRKAAERMIELREHELKRKRETRQRLAEQGLPRRHLQRYDVGIRALENNLRSWADYIAQGCPREGRATTIPGVTR